MARLSKNQEQALAKMRDAAASGLNPLPLARRFMSALSLAIPFDGYRFFQIDPQTLLISRLLDASENDRDPRGEWLGEVYLRSGDLTYIELPEQMRAGVTSLALHDVQNRSFGLTPAMRASITPETHYERFHELRSPNGGTLFGTFHANGLWVAALQAYRRDGSPSFRRTDVDFVRLIGPMIGEAIAASVGRERATSADQPLPEASGMMLIARSGTIAPLTPATERWIDALSDSGEPGFSSAVMTARAALLASNGASARRLIAQTRTGSVSVEASFSGADGGVAVVISPAGLRDRPAIPAEWGLTNRERDISLLLVQGAEIAEIASRSFLAPTTVQWHLANVYEKIGANGRSGLIARFFKDVVYAGIAPETPAGDALTQP